MTNHLHIGTSMTKLRIVRGEDRERLRLAKERREHLLAIARERKPLRISWLFSGFRQRWVRTIERAQGN